MLTPPTLTSFRRRLVGLIAPATGHLAEDPSTAFVWPTESCSIGCAHCNFASVRRRGGQDRRLTLDPATLLDWLTEAKARRLVLCGGGEPLDEPAFCRETIRLCGRTTMDFGIYTSGSSLEAPAEPEEYIRDWKSLRGDGHPGAFWVRLSLDAFHADRLGTSTVADWIAKIDRIAPEWKVTVRTLRVIGDTSVEEVAGHLGARLRERGPSCRLVLPSGRNVVVERMAFVVDGRGTLDVLARRGLELPPDDVRSLAPWQELVGRRNRLGRPLSRRLTVGARHVDLEIHADATVHVLEAQPFDNRLSLQEYSWPRMREIYYRDPLVHAVGTGGLELAASLIGSAIEEGVAPRSTVPFSIERIEDARALDWITAAAVLELAPVLGYPDEALALAREALSRT